MMMNFFCLFFALRICVCVLSFYKNKCQRVCIATIKTVSGIANDCAFVSNFPFLINVLYVKYESSDFSIEYCFKYSLLNVYAKLTETTTENDSKQLIQYIFLTL